MRSRRQTLRGGPVPRKPRSYLSRRKHSVALANLRSRRPSQISEAAPQTLVVGACAESRMPRALMRLKEHVALLPIQRHDCSCPSRIPSLSSSSSASRSPHTALGPNP